MNKVLKGIALGVMSFATLTGCASDTNNSTEDGIKAGVFYYNFSDIYISTVRANMDDMLEDLGMNFQNYDASGNQATQMDQINTAIANQVDLLIVNPVEITSIDIAEIAKAAGIPVIFFNREVTDDVILSYDNSAYIGTSSTEAGHLQGAMIGEYLLDNYDLVDLNGDGEISYVMFKGQEGNVEADGRTKYSVEDTDAQLVAAGKPKLAFYDDKNTAKYLVDQGGNWSAQAATDYMNVILAEYSEANGNMIELVIANNDGMAEGAISALHNVGFNTGSGKSIPVYGVDATDSAKQLIAEGKMTGTVMQDAQAMAAAVTHLAKNVMNGEDLMAHTEEYNVDATVDKIRVPYSIYSAAQ
ncbi:galactose ABC transporter substrate-binding protein [Candidatus Epulonipiscium viviparus]|uniref:galactose ABC transporter substrate-binding protein n=1 Tax=Candidatus Epulonipiscium viviparus TaxID=420336 RepID=UPI00273813AE|nr:galactose ABC transporter substrate-binding protein [Candidatus Epulopiscium viviparus]